MKKKNTPKLPFGLRMLHGIKLYGWLLLALVIGILAISAHDSREASQVDTVAPVVLPLPDGQALVTPSQLLERLAASLTRPLGELSLADVDIERVEEVIEHQAFVADADAFVDDDLQLNIIVTQRVPLLRIIADNGQNYYLDEEGHRMPLSEEYTARVPVVTGNVMVWSDDFLQDPDHQLNELLRFGHFLRNDEFLSALVEQIYINAGGEWVLAPKVGDQVIHIGRFDEERTAERLKHLKDFYREGIPYEGWGKYKSFDLRYKNQVVARKRKR